MEDRVIVRVAAPPRLHVERLTVKPPGVPASYHVNSFGAVPGNPSAATKTANVLAIQAALNAARAAGGGEVLLGPGVYWTDDAVGYDLTADSNVGVIVRGVGHHPTMIRCTATDVPCFRLHTTTGNIRAFTMEKLMLRGGRHDLSLHRAAYNRFNDVWFWVANEWGIQSYLGQQNQFNGCSFVEVGASGGDAALFISSVRESLNHCTFGERGGSVVGYGGQISVIGGTGYGAWYRGNSGYRWDTGETLSLGLSREAAFSCVGGRMLLNGVSFGLGHSFAELKSCYSFIMTGCDVSSGQSPSTPPGSDPGFDGFIRVSANPLARLGLVCIGNRFHVRANVNGADSGFVIEEGDFEGCIMTDNLLSTDAAATLIPLTVSAPSLFDPANGNICRNVLKTASRSSVEWP